MKQIWYDCDGFMYKLLSIAVGSGHIGLIGCAGKMITENVSVLFLGFVFALLTLPMTWI
ncbi:hypothetical protein B0T17DRAFT_536681 [Bombardia bombarda]|uniref:Uncharacterized protein n=1 Tax=Bombardia bombarda TaxID=252184 RepID=A0AA39WM99_9PEZI|nr:hypothetical protein B0T17DRAFT_536681 [Bombardia bombarda]